MIIFYEVTENTVVDGEPSTNELAAVDVTAMTEQERADILTDLKTIYGESCAYHQHNCQHDEGLSCSPLETM